MLSLLATTTLCVGCGTVDPLSMKELRTGFRNWYRSQPTTVRERIDPNAPTTADQDESPDVERRIADLKEDLKEIDEKEEQARAADADAAAGAPLKQESRNQLAKERALVKAKLATAEAEKNEKQKTEEANADPNPTTRAAEVEARAETKVAKAKEEAAEEVAQLSRDRFLAEYQRLIDERLEKAREAVADELGVSTETNASLVFSPVLETAQPALVQSFSLRNFFQALWSNADPTDVRAQVRQELLSSRLLRIKYTNPDEEDETALCQDAGPPAPKTHEDFDLRSLNEEEFALLVDSIARERLEGRYWWTRYDWLSVDFGIAPPSTVLGDPSRTFERKVDEQFPQFLFGLGANFNGLRASGGAMVFRDNRDRLSATGYFGISIELFQTQLNFSGQTATTGAVGGDPEK